MTVPVVWADIAAMYEKLSRDYRAPRASLLQCGCDVPGALLLTLSRSRTYPLSVDRFAGIPIVVKPELAPDQWQLVDQFGEVLSTGLVA